ncbi:helix-hairpin-helix domain-containing protein [Chloroflexota bacterium]
MTTSKLNRCWTLITILLVAIIAISSIVACSRYSRSRLVEISIPSAQELQGEIFIGGTVSNPGFYPLKTGDTIEALIQAAGGTSNADLSRLKLHVLQTGDEEQPQKIDLNRAEAWLIEALPEIGEDRAQDIVAYREQNGLFHNITEITKVKGIGTAIYEQIKHMITVAD